MIIHILIIIFIITKYKNLFSFLHKNKQTNKSKQERKFIKKKVLNKALNEIPEFKIKQIYVIYENIM